MNWSLASELNRAITHTKGEHRPLCEAAEDPEHDSDALRRALFSKQAQQPYRLYLPSGGKRLVPTCTPYGATPLRTKARGRPSSLSIWRRAGAHDAHTLRCRPASNGRRRPGRFTLQTGGGPTARSPHHLWCQPLSGRCRAPTRLTLQTGTCERTRTSNILILNQTPLPTGLHGQIGAGDRIQTCNRPSLSRFLCRLGYAREWWPAGVTIPDLRFERAAPRPLGERDEWKRVRVSNPCAAKLKTSPVPGTPARKIILTA